MIEALIDHLTNWKGAMHRRHLFFINKNIQVKFVAGFTIIVLAGFFTTLLLAYFFVNKEIMDAIHEKGFNILASKDIIGPVLFKLTIAAIPAIIVTTIVIGQYMTNRIELPLLKLMDKADSLKEGDFSSKSTSGSGGLPGLFDNVSEKIGQDFISVRNSSERLSSEFARLYFLLKENDKNKFVNIAESLGKIKAEREEAQIRLGRYKV